MEDNVVEVSSLSGISNAESVIKKSWEPTDKQRKVIELPDEVFEALGGGAAGGGKTDLGILLPCIREFTNHPKFKALMMRRTFADLEKEIVPRQHEWYSSMGAIYNETKKRWRFPAGSFIQNGHAEREQDVRKYDSAEYNYIDWDECTHFTGFQYLYLSLSRCRSSSPDLPAFVRGFTNPGNVGHSFFKGRFVDPSPSGGKIILDKATKQLRAYIPFLGIDNPHLLKNDPGYLARLEGLPDVEKKAKLYGDWNSYEGQVFSEFRVIHLSDEPENAVHVIAPFQIPDYWPRILGIDWGYAAMTYAIWGAISPEGKLIIYRTAVWTKTPISMWSRELVTLSANENMEDVVICHSAGANRGEELTIQQQIFYAFDEKYAIRLAEKDRIGGKNLVHEYLRWTKRPRLPKGTFSYDPTYATWVLRNKGEQAYNEYLMLFVEVEPENNIPKLLIFSHSLEGRENKELIDVIPACMPDENNPEDVAEFPGDDPYDALRMMVRSAHRYTEESKTKFNHFQKLEKLYAINTPETQTQFYRELERSEAEDNEVFSVRGHRRVGNRRLH